jgi:hypothetical protein
MPKPIFWVDIPDPNDFGREDSAYVNVASFDTRQEAVDYCAEMFGAVDGKIDLISEGEM